MGPGAGGESEIVTLVVQVNGKVRDRIEVAADIAEIEAVRLARGSPKVQRWLEQGTERAVIARPPNLVNFVVSE